MRHGIWVVGSFVLAAVALMGCDEKKEPGAPAAKGHDHGHVHGHGHAHHAPHGGTLVAFGDHVGHVELVLDEAEGKLTAYVLDGEAEKAVRVGQKEIVLKVDGKEVALAAVASELTGEKAGDTSEFAGQADMLKGIKAFDGVVTEITVRGKAFKDVAFKFPQGNESHAGHEH